VKYFNSLDVLTINRSAPSGVGNDEPPPNDESPPGDYEDMPF